ncbi:mucin-7-like [Onychostoma macrolepis]|uniref:mucin-7-like n=1 Tax=Onychostoma macrolepis TaxID=369639 RepID=UPI00272D6374|nr:mucin-7-like [Onychostoma macrolepis]
MPNIFDALGHSQRFLRAAFNPTIHSSQLRVQSHSCASRVTAARPESQQRVTAARPESRHVRADTLRSSRSQALLWVPDPSWWAPALSTPPWWSSAPPVPSAPLWWSTIWLWWSSALPWGAPALSVLPLWSAVWLWWSSTPPWRSSVPSSLPWWAPVPSAPPWWAPGLSAPPRFPAVPALPRSQTIPLPHGPGPPSLPLFRLRSTSLLDYRLCGESGSRSLGVGSVTNPVCTSIHPPPEVTRSPHGLHTIHNTGLHFPSSNIDHSCHQSLIALITHTPDPTHTLITHLI